jgi:hypothetical protein
MGLFRRRKPTPSESDVEKDAPPDVAGLYQLAYQLSLRSLDQQEGVLNELRSRTGTLLAASSLVASFLGARAAAHGRLTWLAILGLVVFGLSLLASGYILLPRPKMIFALRGSVLLEEEFGISGGLPETHRRLAYWLEGYHGNNQDVIDRMFDAFVLAAVAVFAEVVIWTGQLLAG